MRLEVSVPSNDGLEAVGEEDKAIPRAHDKRAARARECAVMSAFSAMLVVTGAGIWRVNERDSQGCAYAGLGSHPSCVGTAQPAAPLGPPGELVWADEFDNGTEDGGVDPYRWAHDVGGNGWGNHEVQMYTGGTQNTRVRDGALEIAGRCEQAGDSDYTAARIHSRRDSGGAWGPGHRLDVRAQMPLGRGTWPAIWMLPVDWKYGGWPDSGEIDILEHVGCDAHVAHGTTHTKAHNWMKGSQVGNATTVGDATDWHTYTLVWEAHEMRWYVDGGWYLTYRKPDATRDAPASDADRPRRSAQGDVDEALHAEWPFDVEFKLIINLALGGSWGGSCLEGRPPSCDDPAELGEEQVMRVDYVRVTAVQARGGTTAPEKGEGGEAADSAGPEQRATLPSDGPGGEGAQAPSNASLAEGNGTEVERSGAAAGGAAGGPTGERGGADVVGDAPGRGQEAERSAAEATSPSPDEAQVPPRDGDGALSGAEARGAGRFLASALGLAAVVTACLSSLALLRRRSPPHRPQALSKSAEAARAVSSVPTATPHRSVAVTPVPGACESGDAIARAAEGTSSKWGMATSCA